MGKQSRKKSAKKGSKEHKAKVNERREKREEHIDNNNNEYDNDDEYQERGDGADEGYQTHGNSYIYAQTIMEGDRVWILTATKNENEDEDDDPGMRRGIVKKITEGDDIAHVQPLAFLRVGNETTWPIPKKELYRDVMNLATRFDVGDRIVCDTGARGWLPGVVTHLWPVWKLNTKYNNIIPLYEIMCSPSMAGIMHGGPFNVAAP